jgi:hypothetical protein
MIELKDATEKLYQRAKKEHIQFPKRWKDVTMKRACGATLVRTYRREPLQTVF